MASALPAGLSARYWQTWWPVNSSRDGGGIRDLLKPGEEWIGIWDGLGLYEGNNKIPNYQTLNFHLTTHRILLEPYPDPSTPSSSSSTARSTVPGLSASLSNVRQTEFYTGFMRSSAKITLSLGQPPVSTGTKTGGSSSNSASHAGDTGASQNGDQEDGWTCTVCAYRNAGSDVKCSLCGVGKDRIPSRTSTPIPTATSAKRRSIPGTPASPISPGDRQPSSPLSIVNDTVPLALEPGGKIACPACTFLNHASMTTCEICSTALPRKGTVNGSAQARSPAAGSDGDVRLDIVRLSFRKGGEKVAYAKLKSVLSQKAWDKLELPSRQTTGENIADGASTPRATAGIDGILQTMSIDNRNRSEHVSTAFADLEVLMVRAGEMVKMAQSLNDKLIAQQRANPPTGGADKARQEEEATLIRTSLVQLGLPAPALTSDMVRSDKEYLEGLARELGALLTGQGGSKGKVRQVDGLMTGRKGRGVIGLDEVWGLWMRARGVALLSPSTLVSILPFLPDQTSPPIRLRTLPSGLKVLFAPTYAPANILARISDLLAPAATATATKHDGDEPESSSTEPSLSLIEIAAYEGLAIGLAKELMDEIERLPAYQTRGTSGIVRDDQAEQGAGGVRWYRDILSGWALDAEG